MSSFMSPDCTPFAGGSPEAEHLCVLVHGLWGNPNHMSSIAKFLREKHSEDELHLLIAKRNTGSFTYDGIELGGERVCVEIEEELEAIGKKGGSIKRLSVVGYSLGGLVARYAVGLLESKGILDGLEPVNFTTFASPHLGVRTPLQGYHNQLWNVIGARTLSKSGRQLFTVDKFRDDGRPLLAILADPNSIFIAGLKKFKRRSLYANAVNDRTAVYYTTSISKTDPFTDLSKVELNFMQGYDEVMLDAASPTTPKIPDPRIGFPSLGELATSGYWWLKRIPFTLALAIFLPIGFTVFFINSGIQTFKSGRRIKLHEEGLAGIQTERYRVPLLLSRRIQDIREAVEETYEQINSSQGQEFLRTDDDEVSGEEGEADSEPAHRILARERRQSVPSQPTLALTPYQFEMIENLDSVGWRKYPVFIRGDRHTHAAIIQRFPKKTFEEGKFVLDHWTKEEFLL